MTDQVIDSGAPAAPAPPPSAPAAPPVAPQPNWIDSITDPEARALVEQKKYASPNDVAVAYRHMVKLHGRAPDVLGLPEKDDDEEGWNNVYTRLGRPSEPTGYAYEPKVEGVTPNEEFLGTMRSVAHKAGLSQKQFAILAEANDGFVKTAIEKMQAKEAEENQKSLAEVQKAFGGEQEYTAATAAGQRAVRALGIDNDTLDKLDEAMGNVAVQKLFATLGQKLGKEADFLVGVDVNGNGMSPQMAKTEMDRLKGDTEFQKALLDPRAANHKANVAKWQDLQRVAFSGGKRR